ncbi:hypothetical protein AAFF_G00196530 [Aldrovandia affinis]|uniref:Uncharacterized protein n=1 Tax=Aldrovandia affinis TaxID=143900 RepID=A0AAD7W5Y8_9TELE|nr:hypothetical protein AAFF_G00196530 [Aldrovandia affinis]
MIRSTTGEHDSSDLLPGTVSAHTHCIHHSTAAFPPGPKHNFRFRLADLRETVAVGDKRARKWAARPAGSPGAPPPGVCTPLTRRAPAAGLRAPSR